MFLVGSDDGHEELLAAANAVTNTGTVCSEINSCTLQYRYMFVNLIHINIVVAYAFSSSFWRQMEQLFRFISEVDIDYLKKQVLCCIYYSGKQCFFLWSVKNELFTHSTNVVFNISTTLNIIFLHH